MVISYIVACDFFIGSRSAACQRVYRATMCQAIPDEILMLPYFQLQLGWVFVPDFVSWRCCVPSASMLHTWSVPLRFD